MPQCCVAANCSSKWTPGCHIGFHHFPKDGPLRKEWIANVNRIDPVTKKLWEPGKNSCLCSKHFEERFYNFTAQRVGLTGGLIIPSRLDTSVAVPTIFSHKRKASDSAVQAVSKRRKTETESCVEETSTEPTMEDEADMQQEEEDPSFSGVDETIGDPYCFESDHVALRRNPDYHSLLRAICILEGQRAKALEDLDLLHDARDKVLQDPIGFVDKLQHGTDLGMKLPGPQKIASLPVIEWGKYTSNVDFSSFGSYRQSARLKRQDNTTAEDENLQRLKSSLVGGEDDGADGPEGFVRGRYKDQFKSVTFNKLWTPEEQQRLDEFLVRYPPEEVEARRWRKIATAFGDRTPAQIASRVQKYFEKLERAKLPIPGRAPNRPAKIKRGVHRHHRFSWLPITDSTFLQSFKPPVMMKEDEDYSQEMMAPGGQQGREKPITESYMDSSYGGASEDRLSSGDTSDAESIPEELLETPEYKELMQLKELRQQKLQSLDPSLPQHIGFKCDKCDSEPIVGTRWHCVDCPSTTSVDFCDTCYDNLGTFETASHNSSHRIRAVKRVFNMKPTRDQDYLNFNEMPGNYNYLDPNYMPAV